MSREPTRLTGHGPPRQSRSGGRIEHGTVSRVVMWRGPLRRVLVTVSVTPRSVELCTTGPQGGVPVRRARRACPGCATRGYSEQQRLAGHPVRVAAGHTRCHPGEVGASPQITQPELRTRSPEIMDAVEHGRSFTVTRDAHRIRELIPLRQRRPVRRPAGLSAMSHNAPDVEAGRVSRRSGDTLRWRTNPSAPPGRMAACRQQQSGGHAQTINRSSPQWCARRGST